MEKLSLATLILAVFSGAAPRVDAQETADLPPGIRLVHTIKAPNDSPARGFVFADQGRQLIATTPDGMHAWDLKTGERRHSWPGMYAALAVSADGTLLAAINVKTEVHVFDMATRQKLCQFRFTSTKPKDGGANDTAVLSFSPDGKRMAVGCFQDVEIWDLTARKLAHRFERSDGNRFGIVEFFPDSKRLVVAGFPTYQAEIWDAEAAKHVKMTWLLKFTRSARLSPDGKILAAGIDYGGSACGIYCFPAEKGGRLAVVSTPTPLNSLAFSSDGRMLAARSRSDKLLLIHFKSLQVVDTLTVKKADLESPAPLAFSPDGSLLAVEQDGAISIWDLKEWRKKLPEYENLKPEKLEAVWQDLSRWTDHNDWIHVPPPVHQLVGVPDQAVLLLGQKLKPAARPNPDDVKRWIGELDHPQFKVRDQATKALHDLDWSAKPALSEVLRKATTAEAKGRIEWLLKNMTSEWSAEHMRQYRAAEILTIIDTEPARQILRQWAAGAPEAYLTELAVEQLRRIEKRKKEVP